MAYFGGTVSGRPWARFDVRFFLLLLLTIGGLIAAGLVAKDSIIKQLAEQRAVVVQPEAQTISSAPVAAVVEKPQEYQVLVANETIPAGVRLRPGMFKLETRTGPSPLANTALLNLNEIDGAYTKIALAQGAPLLKEIVSTSSAGMDITQKIPPGFRAVAIPVNVVTGVEGWVQPGARVDVVWTTENRGKIVATTIVENAQVLSAERRLEVEVKDSEAKLPVPNHVTLLVTASDSQKLQLAKNSGSLSLSLRGDMDVDVVSGFTLSTDAIMKNRPNAKVETSKAKVTIGGRDYVLDDTRLIPSENQQERAKPKAQIGY